MDIQDQLVALDASFTAAHPRQEWSQLRVHPEFASKHADTFFENLEGQLYWQARPVMRDSTLAPDEVAFDTSFEAIRATIA